MQIIERVGARESTAFKPRVIYKRMIAREHTTLHIIIIVAQSRVTFNETNAHRARDTIN